MASHSSNRIVTEEEIKKLKIMGYSITSGTVSFTDFLKINFPGFQIVEFLLSLENVLRPLTNKPVFRELAYYEVDPPMLIIQFYSEDYDDESYGLAISRNFVRKDNQIIAEHNFLKLPIKFRNIGIGKSILSVSLKQYLIFGVDKIKLYAALDDGGLVWAKAFFTALIKEEVTKILDEARKRIKPAKFKFVKRIYDNYYNHEPNGKAFPIVKWTKIEGMDAILRGSSWHGEIDLNNSELLAKFRYYVT